MDMSHFVYVCFNIQKLGLTRHTLFPVSPGCALTFIVGNTLSLILSRTSERTSVRKINKVTKN